MLTTVWIIQIITAVLLILLVLLHSPKGGGIGVLGDTSSIFSSQKSAEKGLNHFTYVLSAIFLVCSFITGYHLFH